METKWVPVLLVMAVCGLFIVSCTATQPTVPMKEGLPGFWLGLWHGIISPVTFFISLFFNSIEIYSYPNSGGWYNFGFMLGIGGFSGGLLAGSRKR